MRKILLLAVVFATSFAAFGQDFSNKGKDFWVAYGYHQVMNAGGGGGNGQNMVLYFAADVASVVTVSIPGLAYTQTYNVAANTIFTTPIIPKGPGIDARLNTNGLFDKGIHITSDFPIVAYAHIYNSSVSGATVLLPTNTLGKEYNSINYTNNSNVGNSNCWFYVIATEPGTTDVEITPSAAAIGHLAGVPFTVTLQQGQVYNVMGTVTGNSGTDLTGSIVKSVSAGNVCKRIAVFSGSGRIYINCGAGGTSSDNYMVQSFPRAAWGKKYLTAPTGSTMSRNIFRVCVSDPLAQVKVNGVLTILPLINNFYYEIPATNAPQLIESNLPITVAQYITTQGTCGNGSPGDPEVIYLSSVEQNISSVLFNSNLLVNPSPPGLPHQHWVNAIIPNGGTALSSFRIDGNAPIATFNVHPQDPAYSYIQIPNLALGQHTLFSDSGFNAIAYGFASTESYGYNAGTNVRDLSKELELETTYGIETSPSVCTNAPFKFKFYIPDSTLGTPPVAIRFDSLRWDLSNPALIVPNNFPIMVYPPGPPPATVTYDSITIKNGKRVTWYSLPTTYYFNAAGNDTLLVTGYTSTNEGCGTDKLYDFAIVINDPPTASFSAPAPGCYLAPVVATETTPQLPKPTYKLWWEFFDPVTNLTTVVSGIGNAFRTATHTFTTSGVKRIRHASITTPGCLSDTIVQNITVPDLPDAIISGNTAPVCINAAVGPDVTLTGTLGTAEYIFTYRINGGAPITSPPSIGGILTFQHPTTVANTFVYELLSVRNVGAAVCTRNVTGQTVTVTITPDATITLTSAVGTDNQSLCINTPLLTNITYAVGGSGTGGTVSGLPPGVNGVYAGGVVTISGTPTMVGVFSYTVSTLGPCVKPDAFGTITVTGDATIALTSAAGSDNQTLCINTPLLVNITYAVGGTGTGGSVAGLPAGVTGIYAGGVITISGTPTVAGVFNYTVSTTGPCVKPPATGTITVNGDGTLALTSAVGTDNQSRCINVAITNITYTVGGTITAANVSGLPAGVTWVFAGGVVTISGAPTTIVGSPFAYTVTTTGPCVTPSLSGTITVNPDAAINLTSAASTTSQNLCRNSTIVNITYSVSGGGTGGTVSGLPTGVTGVYAAGVVTISGTPSVAGLFNYTVNTTGTCVQASATGYINVYQLPTAAFNSTAPRCETRVIDFTDASVANTGAIASWLWDFGDGSPTSPSQNPSHVYATAGTYNVTLTVTTDSGCISDPIANIVVTIDNRPEAGFIVPDVCINDVATPFTDTSKIGGGQTINRPLNQWNYGDGPPASPSNNSVGINGLHLYTATGVYQVTQIVTSTLGCKDTIVLPITINSADPVSAFTTPNSCSSDSVALTNLSTVGFGSVTRLDIYWDNVGTPAVFQTIISPAFNGVYKHKYPTLQTTQTYNIRMVAYSGAVCSSQKINPVTVYATPRVQFNNIPNTCLLVPPFLITQGSEIGGVPGTFAYSGPGITNPNGTFNPQVAGIGTHNIKYTWTASNPGACIDTLTKTITVLDTAHATFSVVLPSCEQIPTSFTDLSTAPASVVLANTVWNFGDGSPVENHTPGSTFGHLFPAPGTYTVTMHNVSIVGCLSTDTSAVITIDPNHGIALTSGNADQTVCINTAILPIVYTLSGGATGVTVSGLPLGVNYAVAGNILTISGTPSPLAGGPLFPFTIITTGNTCVVANAAGSINVLPDHTIALNSGNNDQTVCINTPIAPIVYTLGGGATGVTVAGLPAGVNFVVAGNTVTISGIPSPPSGGPLFPFTIVTTGNACIVANAAGSINVQPDHTIALNSGNNTQTVCINIAIAPIVYTLGGGATGVTVTGLPAGVNFAVVGNTLTISGTPSPLSGGPLFPFTILTTGNTCIVANAAGSINVLPDHTISFSSGDTAQSVCVNTPIDPIVYDLGGGATGVTIANLPPGVTFNVAGTTLTISGTPTTTVGGPLFNFAIQTTGNACIKANTIGEILVNPYPVPDFTFDKGSYCIPNAIVGFINNTTPTPLSNYTYAWDFNDGSPLSTAVSPTHRYASEGPFNVKLTARSTVILNGGIIGCAASMGNQLNTIHPQPKADFVFSKPSVCIGDNVIITDATDGKDGIVNQWNWNMGDGSTRATNPVSYTFADTITYTITMYSINTPHGCNSDTISKTFTVYPYPYRNAGPDKFVLEGGSVELEATAYAREPIYTWTPVQFLTDNKILRPRVVNPTTDMTYRLTVTGKGGCQASDDVFVKLLKFPTIPNTFTPNGDGINDQWRIDYLNSYPDNRVQIFTRAGKLVFESKGYGKPWDGTLKGKPLPFDTYYYIIEPGNGRDPITGYVTIIK